MAGTNFAVPRRTRRSRTTRQPRRVRRLVSRMNLGSRITPTVDPPQFTACPWWPLTVMETVIKDTVWTPKTVHASILATLGLTGAKYIDKGNEVDLEFKFRISTVRMWGLDKQPIQLAVCDASDESSTHWTHEFNDFASGIQFSRLGWRFGDVFVHRVLTAKQDFTLFALGQQSSNRTVLVYIQVLLRIPNAPDPALRRIFSSVARPREGFEMDV